jgi:putative endonuclease
MESLAEDQGERYFVYMACCANDTLYVGYTTNVSQRLACHNAGHGGRYTRTNRPLTLIASWAFNSRWEARLAERQLKRLSPEKKRALAASTILPLEGGHEDARTQTPSGNSL